MHQRLGCVHKQKACTKPNHWYHVLMCIVESFCGELEREDNNAVRLRHANREFTFEEQHIWSYNSLVREKWAGNRELLTCIKWWSNSRELRWFANLSYEQDWHQMTRSDNSRNISIFLLGSYKYKSMVVRNLTTKYSRLYRGCIKQTP